MLVNMFGVAHRRSSMLANMLGVAHRRTSMLANILAAAAQYSASLALRPSMSVLALGLAGSDEPSAEPNMFAGPKAGRPHTRASMFAANTVTNMLANMLARVWGALGMRTVTNYFLVNLSISDLLMSLLNCIFNFTFMLDSHWPFGAIYCTVNNFVAHVSVAASVFTLVAISLDRYVAIVRPLKHRMSRRKARIALIMIWLSSSVLALPCLIYSTTKSRR
ncbi:hypothetical protein GE061_011376 [Apolygus lucorum]|uniref:G-protein coupled receptors family 1 profile domain-containing protein n=1 Tax=Apolygus lucorum TaxID=248454 RepID=A0A8S9XYG0_APOLU|nr:hypothetical protein GE061_011376 [Apolygus lucorum]